MEATVDDYVYSPRDASESNTFSTKLSDLDRYEILNRTDFEYGKVENPNASTDVTAKPIYMKTVPENGVIGFDAKYTANPRTRTLSDNANHDALAEHEERKIENLSVKNFLTKISNGWMGIINDLLSCSSLSELVEIFTKDDRLISVGILFVIISVFFTFFNNIDS